MPDSRMTSSRARRGVVLAALLALACPARPSWADEVYKSIDAQGHVVYSDRPDPSAQRSEVRVDRPDPKEVARIAKDQEMLKAEEIQRNRQKAVEDAKKAQADHANQVQCENARNHYYLLKDSRRIYQRDAEGNRVYYSDQEADGKREEARVAMTAACGS